MPNIDLVVIVGEPFACILAVDFGEAVLGQAVRESYSSQFGLPVRGET